jgi:molybdate transport system regulatory protein
MAVPVIRFRIDFTEHSSIGPGKIALLEAIQAAGSLSGGARKVGMSYRRAWLLIESLRQSFREPVTVAATGGKDGGGMRVTEFGDTLIKNYRELEKDFASLARRRLQPIAATVLRKPSSRGRNSLERRL